MCCQPGERHQGMQIKAIPIGDCCGSSQFSRRFFSSEEEKTILEEYKEQLSKELAGVEEQISKLKKK